jgi:glycosyltransferase involved in cell wall biosynthesis
MCEAFKKNNHVVTLVAPNKKIDISLKNLDIFEYYDVKEKFFLKKLPWPSVPRRGYLYGLICALYAWIKKPDIIYGRHLAGCAFCSFIGLPTAYEVHDTMETKYFLERWLFKRMIAQPKFRGLISITKALKFYYLSNYKFLDNKILVAPDGANKINQKKPRKNSNFCVGYVGSLYKGRGHEMIIEFAKKIDNLNFLIVGENNLELSSTIPKNLLFTGFLPYKDAEQYRLSCDILLAPYQRQVSVMGGGDTSKWMSPLKIFEYMAAGKAIIASNLDVLKEILEHEKNALLCDPENTDEWVNAINRLKNDRDLMNKLATNAKNDFEEHYTWQKRAKNIIAKICEKNV